jgi:hypothetical protein
VNHRDNSNRLRFAFAFTVFRCHAHALSSDPAVALLSRHLSADLAVKVAEATRA